MKFEVIFAGFGGQGILFAGNLFAQAAMEAGYHVTFLPVYGPEMRGGTCNCTVVISEREIASPVVTRPKALLVMNAPSFEKFVPRVRDGGLVVVNGSLVERERAREFPKKSFFFVPADEIAEGLGFPALGNMAALGVLVAASRLVAPDYIRSALKSMLPPERLHLLEPNIRVFEEGYEYFFKNSEAASLR